MMTEVTNDNEDPSDEIELITDEMFNDYVTVCSTPEGLTNEPDTLHELRGVFRELVKAGWRKG
jgi:hypothetical protein